MHPGNFKHKDENGEKFTSEPVEGPPGRNEGSHESQRGHDKGGCRKCPFHDA